MVYLSRRYTSRGTREGLIEMMIEQLLDQEQEAIVDVDKLSVTFGSQEVLKDITLKIPPGQTLACWGRVVVAKLC